MAQAISPRLPSSPLTGIPFPDAVVAADVNGDGNDDLAVAEYSDFSCCGGPEYRYNSDVAPVHPIAVQYPGGVTDPPLLPIALAADSFTAAPTPRGLRRAAPPSISRSSPDMTVASGSPRMTARQHLWRAIRRTSRRP